MSSLTGTRTLVRFMLRRDRVRLPVWVLSIVGFVVLIAMSFTSLFPTEQDLQARATLMDSPTAKAFRGPGHGLDNYTYGAMLANEMLGYAAIATALMSIFLVVRHTRTEEESGRLELMRAAVLGRYASPAAALVVVTGANVLIAGLVTLLLTVASDEYPFAGALAFGMAIGSVGLVFAAVAAVTAQLSEYGRGASGLAGLTLGVTFVLRAVGDLQDGFLSWLSPIGWAQATRAFVDERWWPLALAAGVAALLVAVAFAFARRRDIGAGLLPEKPGPPRAAGMLLNPVGFALRRQMGTIIGWGVGLFILGAAFGAIAGDIDEFLADSPQLEEFLEAFAGATLLDSFFGMLVMLMAMLAAGYAVSATLRPRSEEIEGRAEPLLATALSRVRWLGSYLIIAMAGSALILVMAGLGLGIAAALNQRDIQFVPRLLGAALVYLPAVWTLVGLTATLFGLLPRAAAAVWIVLVYSFVIGLFGEQLQLPGWMFELSPYEHTPRLPAAGLSAWPLLVLTALALGLIAAGLAGIRRRDIPAV